VLGRGEPKTARAADPTTAPTETVIARFKGTATAVTIRLTMPTASPASAARRQPRDRTGPRTMITAMYAAM